MFSSPFLGTFFQWGKVKMDGIAPFMFSSPFLGTFFQFVKSKGGRKSAAAVFVPFLGDFLSINLLLLETSKVLCFRPLSWGLSFNVYTPFGKWDDDWEFSSPFLGTFFQFETTVITFVNSLWFVFVPFLGDFLSMSKGGRKSAAAEIVFVPFLGDFLSILVEEILNVVFQNVFVPFLGDFLSMKSSSVTLEILLPVFVPFLGDFLSIACLRSPSPSALASAFAAGMGEPLHQALSFGDEMPIFPGRTGIGGDL